MTLFPFDMSWGRCREILPLTVEESLEFDSIYFAAKVEITTALKNYSIFGKHNLKGEVSNAGTLKISYTVPALDLCRNLTSPKNPDQFILRNPQQFGLPVGAQCYLVNLIG